jgi:hypothetical protein
MLDSSFGVILSGLVLGAVGFVLFMHGKRQSDLGSVLGGIALGVLPMVVHSLLLLWLAGAGVIAGVVLLRRGGGFGGPAA